MLENLIQILPGRARYLYTEPTPADPGREERDTKQEPFADAFGKHWTRVGPQNYWRESAKQNDVTPQNKLVIHDRQEKYDAVKKSFLKLCPEVMKNDSKNLKIIRKRPNASNCFRMRPDASK